MLKNFLERPGERHYNTATVVVVVVVAIPGIARRELFANFIISVSVYLLYNLRRTCVRFGGFLFQIVSAKKARVTHRETLLMGTLVSIID